MPSHQIHIYQSSNIEIRLKIPKFIKKTQIIFSAKNKTSFISLIQSTQPKTQDHNQRSQRQDPHELYAPLPPSPTTPPSILIPSPPTITPHLLTNFPSSPFVFHNSLRWPEVVRAQRRERGVEYKNARKELALLQLLSIFRD
jgi:hypothetical protein